MSWRDSTPLGIQDDLDLLAFEALSIARQLLDKHREFDPFGLRLPLDDAPELLGVDPGEPSAQAALELLYESADAMRDGTRAAAFAAAVDTANGDAVRIELEHRDGGPALVLLLPYTRRSFRRSCQFEKLTAEWGQRRVWP